IRSLPLKRGEAPASTRLAGRIGGWMSACPDVIINNSTISLSTHVDCLRYRKEKQVLIPNGFDTVEFRPRQESVTELRNRLRIPDTDYVVGMVARYDKLKDHPNFFEAAGLLVRQGVNVTFVLVGAN